MMAKRIRPVVFALGMFGSIAFAEADVKAKEATSDRMRYQQLTRELKTVDEAYHSAMKQAVLETQKQGQATLETKSRLLSLANRRDRLINRITLLALRHGWSIPGRHTPKANRKGSHDETLRIFEPADRMIRTKFKQDARRIAAHIALPPVSLQTVP